MTAHDITKWIMAQPRKCLLDDYASIFRYVCFCLATGKMSVAYFDGNNIEAVIFHWPDNYETMEHKAENRLQQFEFAPVHKGNVLFIGEVIGSRKGIAKIYRAQLEQNPVLKAVPYYTFRKGKLVRLRATAIIRLLSPKEVARGE